MKASELIEVLQSMQIDEDIVIAIYGDEGYLYTEIDQICIRNAENETNIHKGTTILKGYLKDVDLIYKYKGLEK